MGKTFIIAEAGVNHCGSVEKALDLVDVAAASGADAVKFQTFSTDLLVSPAAPTAEYQRAAVGVERQGEMLRKLELSREAHVRLAQRCASRGIEFMSTPFDLGSAEFLVSIGMRRMKVPSGELTNDGFLRALASMGIPLVVSTGMATLDEVRHAAAIVRHAPVLHEPGSMPLVFLHCTSNYPAQPADVNLRAMQTIAEATGVPVGYSDHTLGIGAALAAVALGAEIIEKHFTLDRGLPGPDHAASLEPDGLKLLVRSVRDVEAMLGSPEKRPTASELPVRDVVRRSIAAARPLVAGQRISEGDLTCLRPGTGIAPRELPSLVGRTVLCDVAAGALLLREWVR
jgi:N,N'-diacetyllegionaminate synthase